MLHADAHNTERCVVLTGSGELPGCTSPGIRGRCRGYCRLSSEPLCHLEHLQWRGAVHM